MDFAKATVLDLRRTDCWNHLKTTTGVDEQRFPDSHQGHDILHEDKVQKAIAAAGFEWFVNPGFKMNRYEIDLKGTPEWVFLGQDALPATLVGPITP
ncbi:MAG: hypothetical protein M3Q30_05150 [Actinomycetota bacterium]|nr:hypothetical protein [Actinomycetota bacterium]